MSKEEKKRYIQFMVYLHRHIIDQMHTDWGMDYFKAYTQCIPVAYWLDMSQWKADGPYMREINAVKEYLLERDHYGSPKNPEDILEYIKHRIIEVAT